MTTDRKGLSPVEYANYVNNLPYPKKELAILNHRLDIQTFHKKHFEKNIYSHGVREDFYKEMISQCDKSIAEITTEIKKLEELSKSN